MQILVNFHQENWIEVISFLELPKIWYGLIELFRIGIQLFGISVPTDTK
jgi:hypothetical protein